MKTSIKRLDSVTHNDTTATKLINDNFQALQQGVEDSLSRTGKTPNFMDAVLDMNSYRIINVGEATEDTDVVNKKYVDEKTAEAVEASKVAVSAANVAKESANSAAISANKANESYRQTVQAAEEAIADIEEAVEDGHRQVTQEILTAIDTIDGKVATAVNTVDTAANEAVRVSNEAKAAAEALQISSYTKPEVNSLLQAKQDKLTAGENITIIDNVISSTGGSGGGEERISNCITVIPQNIKLTLENNILIVKAGSVLALTGSSAYTTITVNSDRTKDFSSYPDGDIVVFANSVGGLGLDGLKNKIGSGDTLPSDSSTYAWYYLTTDYSIYHWENSTWIKKTATYPLCMLNKSGNNVSFAKDSNGNDMIFNGAGFIGHHAFVLPGVKGLAPNLKNVDGTLKSFNVNTDQLSIIELRNNIKWIGSSNNGRLAEGWLYYTEVDTIEGYTIKGGERVYDKSTNTLYLGNTSTIRNIMPLIKVASDGTTVTDFTIRQPVRLATTEMLDSIRSQVAVNTQRIGELQLFKFPNAVIIGEPTIQNGQVSDFSTVSYLQFPFELDLRDQPFQIDFSFTTAQNVQTQQNILDSNFGIALAVRDGKGLMAISSNGTSWDIGQSIGTMTLQPNTTYYARLTWDRLQYKTYLSTDGVTYTQDMVLVGAVRPYPRTIFIGGCNEVETGHTPHPFLGTINLNKAFLSVRGNVIWQGMDDAGLSTRADISLSNLDPAGIKVINDIIESRTYDGSVE